MKLEKLPPILSIGLFYCYAIVGLKFYGLLSVNFSVSSVTTGLLNTTAVLRMQVTSS